MPKSIDAMREEIAQALAEAKERYGEILLESASLESEVARWETLLAAIDGKLPGPGTRQRSVRSDKGQTHNTARRGRRGGTPHPNPQQPGDFTGPLNQVVAYLLQRWGILDTAEMARMIERDRVLENVQAAFGPLLEAGVIEVLGRRYTNSGPAVNGKPSQVLRWIGPMPDGTEVPALEFDENSYALTATPLRGDNFAEWPITLDPDGKPLEVEPPAKRTVAPRESQIEVRKSEAVPA